MEFNYFLIFLISLTRAWSLSPRCNIITINSDLFIKDKNRISNNNYRINKNNGSLLYFINSPFLKIPKFNNYKLHSNSENVFSDTNKPELSNNIPSVDSTSLANSHLPLIEEPSTTVVNDYTHNPVLSGQSLNNPVQDCNLSKNFKLVKLTEYQNGISRFISKLKFSDKYNQFKSRLNEGRLVLKRFFYPPNPTYDSIRFTNLKILERVFLVLSSAMGQNIKPYSYTELKEEAGILSLLRSKFSGTKLSTILLTTIFKDVSSRALNYYWFNKFIRISDNPKLYRFISTLGYSVVSLWDFLINFLTIEPKTVLLAVNYVLKQLFLATNNMLNNHYYNSLKKVKNVNLDGQVVESDSLREYKDESIFVFDLLGMSLGMLASSWLNDFNSNEAKVVSILSSLFAANALTGYLSTKFNTSY